MSQRIKNVVNEVVEQDPVSVQTPPQSAPQTPSPESEVGTSLSPEVKNALVSARQKMKAGAKRFVVGGVLDALQEISAGNLEDIAEDLIVEIEEFTEGVSVPKLQTPPSSQSTLFALPQGGSPRK